ncbi:MAG TPA: thioredoxin domain-containing protein [Methanocorpusculum sp.]|mgnify:FL=1|nr:thioredoxin domain-containing protein [Methanocorpusculum sp.]HJK08360.1 thioredoxin domain-containing protein [Methanocorpusculum sp.]HJK11820.1 thioredoxin domain-containing protein [Methanocorpusculum sp.]HJK12874.1 thioredoxin domain-containing protein [Methanocorpusculum sp.]HJK13532.1 thioredoxin domain-containing protein [Methanocorpusculum sp.]
MTKPVLYDFFATWCGPCRIQSPIIDALAEKIGDKVDVKKVDVDQFPDLSNKYQISVVPTLIIEKDGKVIHRLEGVTDAARLEALLIPLY